MLSDEVRKEEFANWTPEVNEKAAPIEKEKPEHLYHASANRDIEIFKPRAESVRDEDEGPVVFATPDKAYAAMFIVSTDDKWTSKSRNNGSYTCVIGNIDRYRSSDNGGAIYEMASDKYVTTPDKGMGSKEWISKEPVTPERADIYESGLEAMIELGVNVYVMEQEEFDVFNSLKQQGEYEEAFKMLGKKEPLISS